jgi:hypothetical protein
MPIENSRRLTGKIRRANWREDSNREQCRRSETLPTPNDLSLESAGTPRPEYSDCLSSRPQRPGSLFLRISWNTTKLENRNQRPGWRLWCNTCAVSIRAPKTRAAVEIGGSERASCADSCANRPQGCADSPQNKALLTRRHRRQTYGEHSLRFWQSDRQSSVLIARLAVSRKSRAKPPSELRLRLA